MRNVELVYDLDCPNIAAARRQLLRAFVQAGVAPRWLEHLQGDAPPYARGYGSPTILVDGRDVADESQREHACCRVYASERGVLTGVPDVAAIVRAIASTASQPATTHRERAGVAQRIEVFVTGSAACESAMALIERTVFAPCEVIVLSASDAATMTRASQSGLRAFPAVLVDGQLVDCCAGRGGDLGVRHGSELVHGGGR